MASLSFPHPSVSSCWASAFSFLISSLFILACWSSLTPYKEGGKSQYQSTSQDCEGKNEKKEGKQRIERGKWNAKKAGGIYLPLPAAFVPPLLGELVGPPLLSNYVEYLHLPLPWSLAFFLHHFPLWSHLKGEVIKKRKCK